jgi:hypothetical protein
MEDLMPTVEEEAKRSFKISERWAKSRIFFTFL